MTNELLNTNMESSDITEAWVRNCYNLGAMRKTLTRDASTTRELTGNMFNYGLVPYDKFFDIVKEYIDVSILQLIVDNNITCAEKQIKISLEMSTNDWYGDVDPSVFIVIEWKHRETNAEVIKRLITSNKRALSNMKRKAKKQNKLAEQIKNMSDADREALRELL